MFVGTIVATKNIATLYIFFLLGKGQLWLTVKHYCTIVMIVMSNEGEMKEK